MTLLVAGTGVIVEALTVLPVPVLGLVDPGWALPVNTLLLIVLAAMQANERRQLGRVRRDVQLTRKDVRDAKRKVGASRRDGYDKDTGERRRWDDG